MLFLQAIPDPLLLTVLASAVVRSQSESRQTVAGEAASRVHTHLFTVVGVLHALINIYKHTSPGVIWITEISHGVIWITVT